MSRESEKEKKKADWGYWVIILNALSVGAVLGSLVTMLIMGG